MGTQFAIQSSVLALALLGILFLIVTIKWRNASKKSDSLQKMVDEMDRDKAEIYSRLKSLEEENKSIKEKMEKTEEDYLKKMKLLEEKEKKLEKDSKELSEKLLKVKAMEETIDMHRMRIGVLETEKRDLESKLENISALKQKELSSEKERLESLKKELKEKTKEAVAKLRAENKELKQKVEKLKERLSLWESVKDL